MEKDPLITIQKISSSGQVVIPTKIMDALNVENEGYVKVKWIEGVEKKTSEKSIPHNKEKIEELKQNGGNKK